MRSVGRLVMAITLLGSVEPAAAEAPPSGKAEYARGEVAFAGGRYLDAARHFEAAFAASRKPALLWNIAASYRKQYAVDNDPSQLRRARTVYETFMGQTTDPGERAEAAREIAAIDDQLRSIPGPAARAMTTSPSPPAAPMVSPAPATPPPTTPTPAAPPQVAPTTSGSSPSSTAAPLPAAPTASTPVHRRWWLWTTVAGVIVVGAGVGLAVALTRPSDAVPPAVNGGVINF